MDTYFTLVGMKMKKNKLFISLIVIFIFCGCNFFENKAVLVCCAPPVSLVIDKDTLRFNQIGDTSVVRIGYGATRPTNVGHNPIDYLMPLNTNIIEIYFTTEINGRDFLQAYHVRALNYGVTKIIITNLQEPSLVDSIFVIVDSNNAM